MKHTRKSQSIASILAVVFLMSMFSLLSVSTPTADAASITKTFEIGAGTGQQRSHFRSFTVPAGLTVSTAVKFKRLGDPGAQNDVPIIIELRQPGATESEDGPLVDSKNAIVRRDEQTLNLSGSSSTRGCSLPWRVRVKLGGTNVPANAVIGSSTVSFNDSARNVGIEGGLITLNKGNSVTKNFGGSSGFGQGTFTVTATWMHAVAGVPNPFNRRILLRFELLRPNGSVAASDTGYPLEGSDTPKMRITFNNTTDVNGQWKIRITNNTNDDVANIDPKAKFDPGCN
ncbi:MAG: hypothetical protein HY231_05125 [Acidobacteria bacterium]|nr:hypothetical protein [Acidobacteriota bacterium]